MPKHVSLTLRARSFGLSLFFVLGAATGTAQAGDWDVNLTQMVPPQTTLTVRGPFTKDGVEIGQFAKQTENGSNVSIETTITFEAPGGANDRDYNSSFGPLVAASNLPSGQGIPDYGIFLAAHGFDSAAIALDSPLVFGVVGGVDVSMFAHPSNPSITMPHQSPGRNS